MQLRHSFERPAANPLFPGVAIAASPLSCPGRHPVGA
jgi:hypothetical protein